jgi:hypothetical protein
MKTLQNQPARLIPYILLMIIACSFGVATLPSSAAAYIDPGTGTMLIQVIAAAIFGALFTIKSWFGSLKSVFIRKSSSEESPSTTKEEEK